MVQPNTIRPNARAAYKLGDEDASDGVLDFVQQLLADTDDRVLHHTTFSFGSKTLALTLQGVILVDIEEADEKGSHGITYATYGEIASVDDTGHDREIMLVFHGGNQLTFRMGNAGTVTQLKQLIRSYRSQFNTNGDPELWGSGEEEQDDTIADDPRPDRDSSDEDTPPTIGERVRFWEEQDRINQALIPRVIRQNELLSKHIAEHDDLPELVGRVISEALAEQARQYEATIETSNSVMKAAYDEALAKASNELAEQRDTTVATVTYAASKDRKRIVILASGALVVATAAVILAILL